MDVRNAAAYIEGDMVPFYVIQDKGNTTFVLAKSKRNDSSNKIEDEKFIYIKNDFIGLTRGHNYTRIMKNKAEKRS
jgi:hypothetical protein